MPPLIAAIGAVAGGLAASAAAGAVAGTMAAAAAYSTVAITVAKVVVGAAVGAIAGAATAALTGGDIGKGALFGAIGGGVVGGFTATPAAAAGIEGATGAASAVEGAAGGVAGGTDLALASGAPPGSPGLVGDFASYTHAANQVPLGQTLEVTGAGVLGPNAGASSALSRAGTSVATDAATKLPVDAGAQAVVDAGKTGFKGKISSLLKFAKDNPELTKVAASTVAEGVKGHMLAQGEERAARIAREPKAGFGEQGIGLLDRTLGRLERRDDSRFLDSERVFSNLNQRLAATG